MFANSTSNGNSSNLPSNIPKLKTILANDENAAKFDILKANPTFAKVVNTAFITTSKDRPSKLTKNIVIHSSNT